MIIDNYVLPKSLSEAYGLLKKNEKSIIIAGGAYLRLQKRKVALGIDIENLGLDYIIEENNQLKIGSMTKLRELEINKYTINELDGALSNMVKQIGGIQLRNIVTVGGGICGRYSFSDILPTLAALNVDLKFYNHGIININEYLENDLKRDILLEIIIDLNQKCVVKFFKNTYKEYSLINLALAKNSNGFNIAVGARPGRAKVAKFSSKILTNEMDIDNVCEMLVDELLFKTDFRASDKYRKALAKTLLKEAYKECE
ncbi:MAG: FAD binding domain-containing protein [Bacillota bacterium]|nr:FAD binding domain-containing protein [Bacillota bacterium]